MKRPDTYRDPRDRWREPQNRSGRWYTIANDGARSASVRLFDEVGLFGVTAADFAAELDDLDVDNVTVAINSPGGNVFDGIAIYEALRQHRAKITTRVDGIAASIASVILQAGDRRLITKAGQVMIHNAWALTVGDSNDHRDMATLLDRQNDVIAGIYHRRSGRPVTEHQAAMRTETWYTADEAVAAGLADAVLDTDPSPNDRAASASLMAMKLALAST